MSYIKKTRPHTKIFIVATLSITTLINTACTEKTESKIKSNQNIPTIITTLEENKNNTSNMPSMLQEIDKNNSKCRGLPGDSAEGLAACEKRDHLVQEAEKAGWCWGPKSAYSNEKHWIQCKEDPDFAPERQWFAHDINHSNCIISMSPADKIREIQEYGQTVKTNDLEKGVVEVEVEIGNGRSQVWTFYRSYESCKETLPRLQKIDSKYE